MDLEHCPDREHLQRYLAEELPADEQASVQRHVEGCSSCSDSIAHAGSDPGSARSGSAAEIPVVASSPRFGSGLRRRQRVVDRARKMALEVERGPVQMGKFRLLQKVGEGAFGAVFRAHDTQLDREVAVKVQRAGDQHGDAEHQKMMREARSAAQLQHPGIVSLYETGTTEDGAHYMVTEYIEGSTLDLYRQQHPLGPQQAARLVRTIARAVHAAHSQGVVHRDLKPSNIMMDRQGHPHILDFGLAKRDAPDEAQSVQGEIMGTPAYMSPEQARGDNDDVDARSDVYGLGVILYELLCGSRPFHGSRQILLNKVLYEEPEALHLMADKIPRDLETICVKAMDKDRHRRYLSAALMADDIDRYLDGVPIQARPLKTWERTWRWCLRNPVASSLLATAALGMVSGFVSVEKYTNIAVEETAKQSIEMQAQVLESVNAFYSELVAGLDGRVAHVTRDYLAENELAENEVDDGRSRALPLPATFTKDVGQRITASSISGERGGHPMEVRLFSEFPWRSGEGTKADGSDLATLRELDRQLDEQRARGVAPEKLEAHLSQIFEQDGDVFLRHAAARVMQTSCLGCHNLSPDSPKTDWKEGDLRGALEIVRPVVRPYELQRALNMKITMVASAAVVMMGLCTALIQLRRRRLRG